MIPGMRNFFRASKLGTKILRTAEALSPLELHYGAGARAVETTATRGLAGNADRVFARLSDTMGEIGSTWKSLRSRENPVTFSEMATKYLQGYNLDDIAAGVTKASPAMRKRQAIRQVTLGAMGVYGGASLLLGESNPIRQTMDFGATAAVHTGIGAGLGGITGSPGVMYGYFGLAALNALRSGDNLGPF